MKKIEINCDYCDKKIQENVLYGSLIMPGFNEHNFCGISCFDDWVMNYYIKNRV